MPVTSAEGIKTPAPADAYALTSDLAAMGVSITQIVKVANVTARNAAASARIAAGRPVTSADMMLVLRYDDRVIEASSDGTTWATIAPAECVSGALTLASLTASYVSAGGITVPAGTWKVEAWGYFDVAEAAAQRHFLQLWNNTAGTPLTAAGLGTMGNIASVGTVMLFEKVTLAAPAVIQARVKADATSGSQGVGGRIMATRVAP